MAMMGVENSNYVNKSRITINQSLCSTPPQTDRQTDGLTCSKSFLTKVMMPSTMITLAPYMDCCEYAHHTHTTRKHSATDKRQFMQYS